MSTTKSYSSWFVQIGICLLAAIVYTFLILTAKPVLSIASLVGIATLILCLYFPVAGILLFTVCTSSLIFEPALPHFQVPGGSLHVTDLLLVFFFGLIIMKLLFQKDFSLVKSPLNKYLLVFYMLTIYSAINAVTNFDVDFNLVMRDVRYLSYYLLFFVVTHLIRDKKNIDLLVKGLLYLSLIVVLGMLAQAAIGESVQILPGRVEAAQTFEESTGGIRIIPPGQALIYVYCIAVFSIFASTSTSLIRSKYFYYMLFIGAGILITYNRNYWAGIGLAMTIIFFISSKENRKRIFLSVLFMAIAGSLMLIIYLGVTESHGEFLSSIYKRFTSLFQFKEVYNSGSMQWRRLENAFAWDKIRTYPYFGIGIANTYRTGIALPEDMSYYIHNGHLWILVKMGLISYVPFIAFFIAYVVRGLKNYKKIPDDFLRAAVLGFTLSILGVLFINIVNPMFMQWFSITVMAIVMGISESVFNLYKIE